MQPYKGYVIKGKALLVHPFTPDWYVGGTVLAPGRLSSIIEVTRFELRFTVSMKELAEWFGLEIARIAVDECFLCGSFIRYSMPVYPGASLITLFALASTFGATVRPICFAVFRLIMNSNFFGCSTGKSEGLAPLRILST